MTRQLMAGVAETRDVLAPLEAQERLFSKKTFDDP